MPDISIRFDKVFKRYRLHRGWYGSLRSEVGMWAKRLLNRQKLNDDIFWALKDVTFEIARGEAVGVIGANGAGKSTILKILSRVTVPTSGSYTTHGRVGALIEIGAGFHPDLTGRDNVYLNGAIMGMRRREIAEKFDRIVAFAEVEQFIDTPIKYYSSGMQVRLGFAVAAHIDPEVLLIDEVLAVGDAAFQTKCLNKLAELKEQDKTIVLVSHSMANIIQHSRKVLWMHGGQVQAYGDPELVVDQYLRWVRESVGTELAADSKVTAVVDADRAIRIDLVTLCDLTGRPREVFESGEPACLQIEYAVERPVPDPVVEVTFQDAHGLSLGGVTTRLDGVKMPAQLDRGRLRLVLRPLVFVKGHYTINVSVRDQHILRYLDFRNRAATLVVEGPSIASREISGHVNYPHAWELE